MTSPVPADQIESIVGIERHPTDHYARAVSAEQTVYILHSQECLGTYPDLTQCPFSLALDEGIDEDNWREFSDRPVKAEIHDDSLDPEWADIPEDERFPPGTRVKGKTAALWLWDIDSNREYVIEEYVDKTERDHPLPYYMVEAVDGYATGDSVPHISLVQVMSAEEHAEAMKMPEVEDLAKALSSAMHNMDEFRVHTSEVETTSADGTWPEPKSDFTHGVTFYGRTEGGRSFGAIVRFTALWETDE